MLFSDLNSVHLDALREISNIGMGNAATALSQMIGSRIDLRVPRVSVAALEEVPDLIGGAEKLVVGVYLQIYGDARGNMLLIFPRSSATRLISMLIPGDGAASEGLLTENSASALREIGNILASSYLSAMGSLLSLTLIPSVPSVAFDMAGAIVDYTLAELGAQGDMTLVIETEFVGEACPPAAGELQGHFFVLPDPQSLEILLRAGKVYK